MSEAKSASGTLTPDKDRALSPHRPPASAGAGADGGEAGEATSLRIVRARDPVENPGNPSAPPLSAAAGAGGRKKSLMVFVPARLERRIRATGAIDDAAVRRFVQEATEHELNLLESRAQVPTPPTESPNPPAEPESGPAEFDPEKIEIDFSDLGRPKPSSPPSSGICR